MNPDFPVLLVEAPSRRGPAETGLEEPGPRSAGRG